MQCFYPIAITEEKILVPCGKCIACLQKRRSDWTFRLMQEEHICKNSTFLTLTYSDDHIPKNDQMLATLNKKHLQDYFKRIRKKSKTPIKYYAIGEYGDQTERPHYHAIIFNADKNLLHEKWSTFDRSKNKYIPLGHTHQDNVTQASIHYVTKYMIQQKAKDYKNKLEPFAIMSNKIGFSYIEQNKKYHKDNQEILVTQKGGQKLSMPKYYRNKIFTEEELSEINEQNRYLINEKVEATPHEEIMQKRKFIKVKINQSSKSKKV